MPKTIRIATTIQMSTTIRTGQAKILNRGKRIRQVRELCGLTQRELAHMAGVSRVLIRAVENNQRTASDLLCRSIALATGCSMIWLTSGVSAAWAREHWMNFSKELQNIRAGIPTECRTIKVFAAMADPGPLAADGEPLTKEKYDEWKAKTRGAPGEIPAGTEKDAKFLCFQVHRLIYAAARTHRHKVFINLLWHACFEIAATMALEREYAAEKIAPEFYGGAENLGVILDVAHIGFLRSLREAKAENRLAEWKEETLRDLDELKVVVERISAGPPKNRKRAA